MRIQYTKSKQVLAYTKVSPIYLLSYFGLSEYENKFLKNHSDHLFLAPSS